MIKSKNITFHDGYINKNTRNELNEHKSHVFWFVGLSASGKSTIAVEVEKRLIDQNILCYRLDGDNLRFGLNKDLSFSPEDRYENIRRIAEVSKLFVDSGVVVLCSFITPIKAYHKLIREILGENVSIIFVDTSLEECIRRDPKGLYKKAIDGEINNFTGISAPFDEPENPDMHLRTDGKQLEDIVNQTVQVIIEKIVS